MTKYTCMFEKYIHNYIDKLTIADQVSIRKRIFIIYLPPTPSGTYFVHQLLCPRPPIPPYQPLRTRRVPHSLRGSPSLALRHFSISAIQSPSALRTIPPLPAPPLSAHSWRSLPLFWLLQAAPSQPSALNSCCCWCAVVRTAVMTSRPSTPFVRAPFARECVSQYLRASIWWTLTAPSIWRRAIVIL